MSCCLVSFFVFYIPPPLLLNCFKLQTEHVSLVHICILISLVVLTLHTFASILLLICCTCVETHRVRWKGFEWTYNCLNKWDIKMCYFVCEHFAILLDHIHLHLGTWISSVYIKMCSLSYSFLLNLNTTSFVKLQYESSSFAWSLLCRLLKTILSLCDSILGWHP